MLLENNNITKKEHKGILILKIFFAVMLVLGMGYFSLGERFMTDDELDTGDFCEELKTEWVQLKKDGTRIPVQIPGCRTKSAITD